jgi:glutathione S-transferase
MLRLFYSTGSCALASHIALEEAGAEHEAIRMDLRAGDQHKPEFLDLNPKGRVPALVTNLGVLTENVSILAFIAQSFPDARLAPSDPFGFGQVQAFNAYLASTVHVAHAHGPRAARWADDPAAQAAMGEKVADNMATCFQLIEDEMFAGPWVMGEQYTICDPYLFTIASWLDDDGVDPSQFPKISEHMVKMIARPAVWKALAMENA